MSSTMRWPRTRSCSQPRASAGSRLSSGDDVVMLDEGFELDEEVAVFLVVAGFLIILSGDRKSTRLNSSHSQISYAVFCLKKKKQNDPHRPPTRPNISGRRLHASQHQPHPPAHTHLHQHPPGLHASRPY